MIAPFRRSRAVSSSASVAGKSMVKDCTFCSILSGRLQAAVVYEDPWCVAFLDHRPLFAGHCLVIPRNHHETLVDLPDDLVAPLFSAARAVAGAIEKGLKAEGSFVAINNRISQSVPHLHIHVVPRRRKDGLKGFFWPRYPYRDQDEMEIVRLAIRNALAVGAP